MNDKHAPQIPDPAAGSPDEPIGRCNALDANGRPAYPLAAAAGAALALLDSSLDGRPHVVAVADALRHALINPRLPAEVEDALCALVEAALIARPLTLAGGDSRNRIDMAVGNARRILRRRSPEPRSCSFPEVCVRTGRCQQQFTSVGYACNE